MIHFEGTKQLALPLAQTWAKLTDLNFLLQCVPDIKKIKEVKENMASLVAQPGLSFVRGELTVNVEKFVDAAAQAVRFVVKSKGIGSSSEVEVGFKASEKDGGTFVEWKADVKQLGGLMRAIPQGLIQSAAQKVIADIMAKVEEKLGK